MHLPARYRFLSGVDKNITFLYYGCKDVPVLIRLFDFLLALVATIVLTPFMIPVMIGLVLTGEHEIFYLQERVGKGGRPFRVFKFATMLKDSPNLPGGVLTQKDDPRVLPMGHFLRKTKINELPQLLNILVGDMSFVGPRPQAKQHYKLYSGKVRKAVASVRPGLTGIGSVVFRDEEELLHRMPGDRERNHDTVVTPYKGELELWFSSHHSLRTWILLILLTAWTVLVPKSKVWKRVFPDLPPVPRELAPWL